MIAMTESYDSLTAKLAPQLQELVRARRDAFIANAGGFARREAVRLAFPTFVAEIPTLLRAAIELISDEFGHMNLNDLLAFLESHAK